VIIYRAGVRCITLDQRWVAFRNARWKTPRSAPAGLSEIRGCGIATWRP